MQPLIICAQTVKGDLKAWTFVKKRWRLWQFKYIPYFRDYESYTLKGETF